MFVNLPYYAVVSVDAEKGTVITKVSFLAGGGAGGPQRMNDIPWGGEANCGRFRKFLSEYRKF